MNSHKPPSFSWVLLFLLASFLAGVIWIVADLHSCYYQSRCNLYYRHPHHRPTESPSPTSAEYALVNLGNNQALRGRLLTEQNVTIGQFLGIPYVSKPKRFRRANPPQPWTGIKDSLQWPPLCPQSNLAQYDRFTRTLNREVSEDCLFLNVWTPHSHLPPLGSPANQTNLLPVIVFVHGGSFSRMGSSMEAFYGGVFAALGQVVFVTFNYRLGVFGFLDNQLESSNPKYVKNVALFDQIAAIQWVRANIGRFGGNPDSITLQGQSAGAISIGLLMISPHSQHLFHRVILQSGSPMMLKQIYTSTYYENLLRLTECGNETEESGHSDYYAEDYEDESEEDNQERLLAEVECLERVPLDTLNQIQEDILQKSSFSFGPIIPSKLLPVFPDEIGKGEIFQKDILLGVNANESTLYLQHEYQDIFPFRPKGNISARQIMRAVERVNNSTMMKNLMSMAVKEIDRRHTPAWAIPRQLFVFLSDLIFKGPVLKFAQHLSETTESNIYLYQFREKLDNYPSWIGCSHWNEMDFVFGMPLLYPQRFSKAKRDMSVRFIKTWSHFARTGRMLPQRGVEWPVYSEHSPLHMNLESGDATLGTNLDVAFYRLFSLVYHAS